MLLHSHALLIARHSFIIPIINIMKLPSLIFPLLAASLNQVLAQNSTSNLTVSVSSTLPFNITSSTVENQENYTAPYFPLLPFTKSPANPILTPNPSSNFESAFLYNPTAIVLNDTIFLLYRAQNESKTSSVGLAWSTDGTNFTRLDRPIIEATEEWEQIGGCEDPRIVSQNTLSRYC